MANVDGKSPDSEKLKASAKVPPPAEPVEEPASKPATKSSAGEDEGIFSGGSLANLTNMDETIAASLREPVATESAQAEQKEGEHAAEQTAEEGETEEGPTEAEAPEKKEQEEEEGQEKEPSQSPMYLEWGIVIFVPLILLVLAVLHLFSFPTAVYLIALAGIPYGLWKGRQMLDVYTLFLACALAAILTAAYVMWLEIARYHYDLRAGEAKQRVSMSQPSAPDAQADSYCSQVGSRKWGLAPSPPSRCLCRYGLRRRCLSPIATDHRCTRCGRKGDRHRGGNVSANATVVCATEPVPVVPRT